MPTIIAKPQTAKPSTGITSQVVSKPGAVISVRQITIPQNIRKAIAHNLQRGIEQRRRGT